jgi:disulfide bond formation protein DsbB
MQIPLSPRALNSLIAGACAASMAFAFYLQYAEYLEPCPLCMTQRIFVGLVGVLAFLAALHNPAKAGIRVYAATGIVAAVAGGGFSGRHLWLQFLPDDQVPACGPSLQYMLETLPLGDTLTMMLTGDGNCAETLWSFLGLSIPAWTLMLFVVLLAGNFLLLIGDSDKFHIKK